VARTPRMVRGVVRPAAPLSLGCFVGGLVWVLTGGSLLGVLLIVGGVGGLGWSMVPDVIDRIARFLSTGSLRGS
jgi:hypothetical protein